MKKIYLPMVVLLSIAVIQFWGCSGNSSEDVFEEGDTTLHEEANNFSSENELDAFKLPSPIELFIYLKENEATFQKDVLSSENEFYTTKSKALNFGIYASDLAYASVFSENQKTFSYYKLVKTLADELDLTEGFDEKMTNRVKENINNTDSLYEITNDAYWEACSFLDSQGRQNILSYVTIGGWLESVYIALNTVDKFDGENKIVIRIAEQHLLLDNLLDHLNQKHKGDEEMAELITKLTDLQLSFDLLYENKEEVITKAQYKEISKKITALRQELVN